MSKLKTLTIFAAMALAVLGGVASEAFAAAEINVAPGRTLKGPGVAVHGYDTVATVRLELDNRTGSRFTDLFTLLKSDGEWKIMNKVFHTHS